MRSTGFQLPCASLPHDGGGLEHANGFARSGTRAIEQLGYAIHRQDRMLGQELEEPQAEHGRVILSKEPVAALAHDQVKTTGARHGLVGSQRDALEEEREPSLPIAVSRTALSRR